MTEVAEPAPKNDPAEIAPWPLGARVCAWGLVSFGIALRLGRWIHFRALWLDEIYLAQSILTRNLHDLLTKSLDNWQAAPAGYLLMSHGCAAIFGHGERSLRLTSLLFGVASLPLAFAVSRRLLSWQGTLVALTLFVFLGPLIYYANELKQYSCDVVASLALTLCGLRILDAPSSEASEFSERSLQRRPWELLIVGALSIFFSHPAVFVIAGVLSAMTLIHLRGKNIAAIRSEVVIALVLAGVFSANYFLFIRPATPKEVHAGLVQYWANRDAFLPLQPVAAVKWLFWRFWWIAQDPGAMWMSRPGATLAAVLFGIAIALWRRGKWLLLLAPLPFVIAASALLQYPFGDRLAIFFVPQILILIAVGIEFLWSGLRKRTAPIPKKMRWRPLVGRILAIVLLWPILMPSADRALGYFRRPPGREETLAAYQWIAKQYQPGDVISLSSYGQLSFRYYKARSGWPSDTAVERALIVQPTVSDAAKVSEITRPLVGQPRVWMVLIHTDNYGFDEIPMILKQMDKIGTLKKSDIEPGAQVYLYDCAVQNPARRAGP